MMPYNVTDIHFGPQPYNVTDRHLGPQPYNVMDRHLGIECYGQKGTLQHTVLRTDMETLWGGTNTHTDTWLYIIRFQ